jgi:hypothetical protein
MTKNDWIPKAHELRYDMATQTWTYISTEPQRSRMGFASSTVQGNWLDSDFYFAYIAFSTAYNAWKNQATRTKLLSSALIDAEKAFIPKYRQLYTGFLKNSPLVTNEDLIAMALPERGSGGRHPSPVPSTIPDSDADTSVPRRVTIHFYDDKGAHKKAKPKGVHCIECKWAIFETRDLPTLDMLVNSSVDTNSPLTLEFDDKQRGLALCYALRWENTRGEKGPFGAVTQVIIP